MRLWRSTGAIHAAAAPPAITLPPFQHAKAIAARITAMREEYATKLEGW
jgi:hypothetical protein